MDFKQEIAQLIAVKIKLDVKKAESLITIPPNPKMGDYAFPCFTLGKNPKEEAEKLKKKIEKIDFIKKIEVMGPYLNFYLDKSILAKVVLGEIYKKRKNYGKENIGRNKTIVLDYSAPNIAKPFGIGHLRSTVIGNCLKNVYEFLGYKTIGVNHLGDWGTQFGKLIVAYKKWGEESKLEENPIKYLLKLYVKFHKEAEDDDSLVDQGREEFSKLEQGDKTNLLLWEKFRELSLDDFNRIYQILGVKFDSNKGEAFYMPLVEKTIEQLKEKVKIEESEGAQVVKLGDKMPPVLIIKSNGATTYHTRDIAAVFYRLQKYRPEKIVYVVGQEQKLHFRQLFALLEKAGFSDRFIHVDFGLFRFPEGKMSTRKGQVIFLEEVLQKSVDLALKIIEEKNPDLENKKGVAQMIGVGAIIFADLSNDRTRNIDFDWDRMLSFEGETAPYVQYTHARACSILRKAVHEGLKSFEHIKYDLLIDEKEISLVSHLYDFSDVLETVLRTYKPHHLAQYLIKLAQLFNEFYHSCQVISDGRDLSKARLLLVDCVRQVLENGLGLLGIKAPQEM